MSQWAAFIETEVLVNEQARRATVAMVRADAAKAGFTGRIKFVKFESHWPGHPGQPTLYGFEIHRGRYVVAAGRIYGASRRARIDLLVTTTLVEEDRLHGLRWGGTTYTGCLTEGQPTVRLEVHPRG